jgi:branched-chain amino acid transport system permease protein
MEALWQNLPQILISGLLMGLVYALVAVGLSLIFGLMDIVNFAHGEFLMWSMYITFWAYTLGRIDPLMSLPLCLLLLFMVGVGTYRGIIQRILGAPPLVQIFATFGLSIFLQSIAQFLFKPDYRYVDKPLVAGELSILGLSLGLPKLVAALGAVAAFGFLYWLIRRTQLGLALQATSEDREAAALMGIDSHNMYTLGWGIGAGCVGVAGALLANFYYIFPQVGFVFALLAYVIVALGGFGSIEGAFLGGIIIGLVEAVVGFVSPEYKFAALFAIYLALVFLRPQGLFGR